MHNDYSEEHLKVHESRRMEDLWYKQGNVIQEDISYCNYYSSKYFMTCWDNHRVIMLSCLLVLLMKLLHTDGSNIRLEYGIIRLIRKHENFYSHHLIR
jgi:hypothetical protein